MVVVGKHKDECAAFDLTHVRSVVDELTIIANPGGIFGGLGQIGNRFLTTSRADVVAVVHADTVFGAGTVAMLATVAIERGALTGLVGRGLDGAFVWCRDHSEPKRVSTLDGCSVFVPRGLKPELRFDAELFDSFHCCVEDLCLTAQYQQGLDVLVPPGVGDHLGSSWPKDAWMAEYLRYRTKLDKKWPGCVFRTT